MAQSLYDTQTTTSTGVLSPATLTKWPEGGGTASVGVAGGAATGVIELWAWNDPSMKELIASFTLPVPVGEDKAGDLYDSLPVASVWRDWEWDVVSLGAGATATLTLCGVGV